MKHPRTFLHAFLLASLLALAGAASAQADDEARAWLERAFERHGGEALRALLTETSSRSHATMSLLGPDGSVQAQVEIESLSDPVNDRERSVARLGGDIVTIEQREGRTHTTWAPHTGALRLPRSQVEAREQSRLRSFYGLARGTEGRDAVEIEPGATLAGLTGTLLRVTTNGVEAVYLLDDDGTVLADVDVDPDLGELISVYTDWTEVAGALVASEAELTIGDMMFARIVTTAYDLDVEFDDADFELP